MYVTPVTTTAPASFQSIRGQLQSAAIVANAIADTFTLKGGTMPSAASIATARDEAMRAAELLWSSPMRTSDIAGTTIENSSILAIQASTSLGRIADEIRNNTAQYAGPNGPGHIQMDAVTAQHALKDALTGVDSLLELG